MEYVEKQYLLAEYDREHEGPPGNARLIIEQAPAADVAPIVHGRWLNYVIRYDGHLHAECSVCHCDRVVDRYCGYCGAKMDMEEENGR